MKKFLLSCCLALGIGANAQTVFYTQDFEGAANGSDGTDIGWTQGYFGTLAAYPYNTFAVRSDCATNLISGTKSLQIVNVANATQDADLTQAACAYANGSATNASYAPLVYTQIDATNYKSLLLSYKWKCQGQANQDFGVLMYSTDGATWTTLVSNLRSATSPYSTTVTDYALPAALNYTTFYIGWRFTHNTTTVAQPGFTIDDISIKGTAPTATPSCTTISAPANGSTVSGGSANITWPAATDASAYKLTVGTTSGGSDVFSGTVVGLSQSVSLATNATYYAKVVPTNSLGDATGCSEISFTTNASIAYCTPSTTGTADELISKVAFSDISNSSTATTGYENFTTVVGNVTVGQAYPITVTVAPAYTGDQTVVWIDYNQDGSFTDSEKTILTGTGPATGTITIDPAALIGNTRMRVRLNYNSPAVTLSPCGSTTYGQSEDYTLNIKAVTLAVSNNNKDALSVYPNPFTDVLKISDVKGVKSVSVNDVSGRQVKSLAPSAELNLSSLKAGLYIVNLKMEDGSVKSFKAIKK